MKNIFKDKINYLKIYLRTKMINKKDILVKIKKNKKE